MGLMAHMALRTLELDLSLSTMDSRWYLDGVTRQLKETKRDVGDLNEFLATFGAWADEVERVEMKVFGFN